MQEGLTVRETICRQLLAAGTTVESWEAALQLQGIAPEQFAAYIDATRRMRYARRRSTGFILMAAGAFLGFLSCVLTITHVAPGMYDFILYGLTSIAVCIVVLGLYYVFE